jgi:bud site selection protein 31
LKETGKMSKFARIGRTPEDFYKIEPTLQVLDLELKRKMSETIQGTSRTEQNWYIHQIDWQRTRYVHDMYYKFHAISAECYEYCCKNNLINKNLSLKWKEKGYERLCSLHAIDSRNFQFGGTSICRVPKRNLRPEQLEIVSVFNGCRGCASGKPGSGAGVENIFGNKYGQRLAFIQVQRERLQQQELEQEEERKRHEQEQEQATKAAQVQTTSTTATELVGDNNVPDKDEPKKKKKKIIKKKSTTGDKSENPWAKSKEEEEIAAAADDIEDGNGDQDNETNPMKRVKIDG